MRRPARNGRSAGSSALLVVDMLNAYDHENAVELATSAEAVVPVIAHLVGRARNEGVPAIYANDATATGDGRWTSSATDLVERAVQGQRPDLVEPIVPTEDDLFVAKVRHSIFYGTPLEYLLRQMDITRIVLTGQVTEQCVLYSALDAYVRHFDVTVVSDGVAHIDSQLGAAALEMMERNMRTEIVNSADCVLGDRPQQPIA